MSKLAAKFISLEKDQVIENLIYPMGPNGIYPTADEWESIKAKIDKFYRLITPEQIKDANDKRKANMQ